MYLPQHQPLVLAPVLVVAPLLVVVDAVLLPPVISVILSVEQLSAFVQAMGARIHPTSQY